MLKLLLDLSLSPNLNPKYLSNGIPEVVRLGEVPRAESLAALPVGQRVGRVGVQTDSAEADVDLMAVFR